MGKYMQYLQEKKQKTEGIKNPDYVVDSRVHDTVKLGKDFAKRISAEKNKHYIGERIVLNREIDPRFKERTMGGCVIGIYEHFLLIDCGNYKSTISYKDLVLGGKVFDTRICV